MAPVYKKFSKIPVFGSVYYVAKNFKKEYFRPDFKPTLENYEEWDWIVSTTGRYLELGGGTGVLSSVALNFSLMGEPFDSLINLTLGVGSLLLFGVGSRLTSRHRTIYANHIASLYESKNGYGKSLAEIGLDVKELKNNIEWMRDDIDFIKQTLDLNNSLEDTLDSD